VSEEDWRVFINLRRLKKLIFKRESKENPIHLRKKNGPLREEEEEKPPNIYIIYLFIFVT